MIFVNNDKRDDDNTAAEIEKIPIILASKSIYNFASNFILT